MANKMILNKSILSRLSLLKYYFEMGYEQSYPVHIKLYKN